MKTSIFQRAISVRAVLTAGQDGLNKVRRTWGRESQRSHWQKMINQKRKDWGRKPNKRRGRDERLVQFEGWGEMQEGEGGLEKDSSTIFEWDYRNDFQCFDKKTVLLLFPQTLITMDFITLISFTDLFRLQLIAFSELKNKNLNQIGILWEEYG